MQVNGKEIFVEDSGDGPAIVMIHGLGGSTNVWTPQARELDGSFRILRMDLEGAGQTAPMEPTTIQSMTDDVVAIMDKAGIGSAYLCGHSMGTVVCQNIAAQNASRIESMTLLGALAEPPEAVRAALTSRAEIARDTGMTSIADAIVAAAISKHTRESNPTAVAFVRELLMRQVAEGYARNCEALAQATEVDLTGVKCPTLLIVGDEDVVTPPAMADELAQKLTSSTKCLLKNCGHWHSVEHPERVTDAIRKFLSVNE